VPCAASGWGGRELLDFVGTLHGVRLPEVPPGDFQAPTAPRWEGLGPRSGRRKRILVAAGIAAALVVGGVTVYYVVVETAIHVAQVDFVSPDDACGTNGGTGNGFVGAYGGTEELVIPVSLPNDSSACVIGNVSSSTAGFSVTSTSLPLYLPRNTGPMGSNGTFDVFLALPRGWFTGTLTLVLS
jgi:hypothetical protein